MNTPQTEHDTVHVRLIGGPLDGEAVDLASECACGCGTPVELGHLIEDEDGATYRVTKILVASAVHEDHEHGARDTSPSSDTREQLLAFRDEIAHAYDTRGKKVAFGMAKSLGRAYELKKWQVVYAVYSVAREREDWPAACSAVSSYAERALPNNLRDDIPPTERCAYIALRTAHELDELGPPDQVDEWQLEETYGPALTYRIRGENEA